MDDFIKYINTRDRFKNKNPKYKLYHCAKARAKKAKMDFTITKEDILIPEYCPYLGAELTNFSGKGRVQSNLSIDRRDSTKGYTKDNIQVISDLANRMKSEASLEQLIAFAKGVLKLHAGIDLDKILIDTTKV